MSSSDSKPRLLVVAGPNGAGKTTITEQGLAHEWFGGCELSRQRSRVRFPGPWHGPLLPEEREQDEAPPRLRRALRRQTPGRGLPHFRGFARRLVSPPHGAFGAVGGGTRTPAASTAASPCGLPAAPAAASPATARCATWSARPKSASGRGSCVADAALTEPAWLGYRTTCVARSTRSVASSNRGPSCPNR